MRVAGTLDIDGQTIKLEQGGDSTTITAGAAASDITLTLPATTDTLVGLATTDTLTNKTLTSPTITTPTITGASTLSINDNGSNDLILASSDGAFSADRTLSIDLTDANRSIDLAGDITTAGDLITSGAYSLTLTQTGATNVTLPTTGTLSTLAGSETLTNKTLTSPVLTTATLTAGSNITFTAQGEARLADAAGGEYMGLVAPSAVTASYTIEIPATTPAANSQALCVTDYTATPVTTEWATVVASLATQNLFVGDGSGDPAATDTSSVGDILADSTNGLTIKSGAELTLPQINDTSSDHQYVFAVNELAADRTVTLPLLTADDTFVFENHTQTLTGKNIGDPSDNTKDIAFTLSGATTAKTLTLISAHTDDRSITFPDATDTLVGKATTDTLTNKTIGDTNTINAQDDAFTIDDASDATKQIVFDAAGTTGTKTTITGSQTSNRVVTLPDATDTLVGKATTDTFTNKTFDANATGNSISNVDMSADVTGTLPIGNGGTGQTTQTAAMDALSPSTTKGDILVDDGTNVTRLAVGADGLILKADSGESSGVIWGSAAEGTGEVNYISNSDAESDTSGWATYKDTAQATPVDGTGSSTETVTWTRQSGVILRGNQSFKMTHSAANEQGEGASYDFTIKGQDTNKKLKIQFDFQTDEDAGYASDDLTVYIYDVTNSTLITPTDTGIIRGQNIFQTSFNSTDSTSYRLILHIATTNATAWDAYIDNVIVGPGMTSQGAAVGPAEAVTVTGSWTSNTTYTAFETRIGEWAHYEIEVATSGAPNSTTLEINLPSGRTINTAKLATGTDTNWYARLPGSNVIHFENGVTTVIGSARYNTTTQVQIQHWDDAAAGVHVNNNTAYNDPFTFGAGDKIVIGFKVPIEEWEGKGIVPMLAEDNLSEWTVFDPVVNGSSSGTDLAYGSASVDIAVYRRVGDSMEILWHYVDTGGNGTAGTGYYQLEIPNNLTINTAFCSTGQGTVPLVGSMMTRTGSTYYHGYVYASTTTTISAVQMNDTTAPVDWGASHIPFNADARIGMRVTIPILEWAGSQNSLVGYSLADKEATGLAPAGVFEANIPDAVTLTERSTTPADPTQDTTARMYLKGDKVVFQFNNGGTVRYKYLDLTGTGVTWVHTTSAP